MSATQILGSLAAIALIGGCGTLEDNAWTTGVSREQALEIRTALTAQKHAHKVYQYQRQDDGSVIVSTDVGSFQARRVRGKWDFTPVGFVGAATQ
jgi:hypothetical protein